MKKMSLMKNMTTCATLKDMSPTAFLIIAMNHSIARNFGRSLSIPDASLQTSVNFPRTRPLKCMEQSAFLFKERIEMTSEAHHKLCFIDEKNFHGLSVGSMALKQHVHRHL